MWTNEEVIQFLELYQAKPVIWDAKRKDHKNKNIIADAWRNIQRDFGIYSIEELKKKRESLMSTYRLYRKKVAESTHSGSSADDIFKPNWFAYEFMDSFLGPIYDKSNTRTINTETMEFLDEDSILDSSDISPTSKAVKRRRQSEISEVQAQVKTAVNVLKDISNRPPTEVNEVDLYCQLLAKKIKKFNDQERDIIMHDIDELIYQKREDFHLHNCSPGSSSIYSSAPKPSPSSDKSSSVYQVADDYGEYIVEPHYSHVEYATDPYSSSTSSKKFRILSNKIIKCE